MSSKPARSDATAITIAAYEIVNGGRVLMGTGEAVSDWTG